MRRRVDFGPNPKLSDQGPSSTKFVGAKVGYVTLGSQWRRLDLTNAVIVGLPREMKSFTAKNSNLTGLSFAGCTLSSSTFSTCVLRGTDFTGALLTNVKFDAADDLGVACDLTGAPFVGATLDTVRFESCVLTKTDFTRAKIRLTTFGLSLMDGTRFDYADLSITNFDWRRRFSQDPNNLTSFRGAKVSLKCLWLTWSYLDLTGATIVDLDDDGLRSSSLQGLKAEYAVLTGLDLSRCNLSNASMTGATLTGVNFTHTVLDGASMYGVRSSCELFRIDDETSEFGILQAALARKSIDGVRKVFDKRDIRLGEGSEVRSVERWWTVTDAATKRVYTVTDEIAGEVRALVVFDRSLVTRFDDASLVGTNFGPDNGRPSVLRGASFVGAAMDRVNLTKADLGPITREEPTTATCFTAARMTNAQLADTVLSSARLTGGVFLHGANLAGAVLDRADLTGAQLGRLSAVFRVGDPGERDRFLAALNTRATATVAAVFAAHQRPLAGAVSVEDVITGRSWRVSDARTAYTVLDWTAADGARYLVVSTTTSTSATLTGAYLPNAVLIDANLSGVSAPRLQLYGDKVRLDSAIFDGAKMPHANLSGSRIAVRALYDVDLGYANLIDCKLSGVDLRQGVTLAFASLQGADLSDAILNGADLTDAAVAVPLTSKVSGSYLCDVTGSAGLDRLLAELRTAADPRYPLVLASASTPEALAKKLNPNDIAAVRKALQEVQVTLEPNAKIVPTEDANAWRVVGATVAADYTLWQGFGPKGVNAVLAQPVFPLLKQALQQSSAVALRWQATVARPDGSAANQWLIDNDSDNPINLQLGYSKLFALVDGNALVFYGTQLHIQQTADGVVSSIEPREVRPTVLSRTSDPLAAFGPDTLCPNGSTYAANLAAKPPKTPEQMLRSRKPPAPPTCVPSRYAYCPQVSAALIAAAGEQLDDLGIRIEGRVQ